MHRRDFISKTAGSVAALAIGAPAILSQPLPDQPNVLFIIYDDMNDWIQCLGGHPQALTPNLNALAESGILFSNAHCNATVCVPSRTSIFCSRRPSSTGVYDNTVNWFDYIDRTTSIAWNFHDNGYHIYRAGKFYHPQEFDIWDDYFSLELQGRPPDFPLNSNNLPDWYFEKFDWGPTIIPARSIRDYRFTDFAIEKLQGGAIAPFFLAVGCRITHEPWYVPKRFLQPFPLESIILPELPPDELDDIPPFPINNILQSGKFQEVRKNQQWRRAVQAYLGTLLFADYQIGRLMNALEDSPFANETIIVLTSDHGIHLGEKFHWTKFGPWREDSHVPLIWRVPGVTPAGFVNSHATELLDIYPTLIDYCGLSPVPDMEGQSIRTQLENPGIPFDRPAITTPEFNVHAIKDDRWCFIRYTENQMELYDHDNDPREHTNLAYEPGYEEIIAELSQWIPDVNIEP